MERFEYKLVEVPKKSQKYTGLKKSDDAFAHTVMDAINEVAQKGWEFLRTESILERRRCGIFGSKVLKRDYIVYRRALHTNGMTMDTPMTPRRVRTGNTANIEQLRERMSGTAGSDVRQNELAAERWVNG